MFKAIPYFIFLLFYVITGHGQSAKTIRLTGDFDSPINNTLLVNYDILPGQGRSVSAPITNGHFDFTVEVAEPTLSVVSVLGSANGDYLCLDTSSQQIQVLLEMPVSKNPGRFIIKEVKGSITHDLYSYLTNKWTDLDTTLTDSRTKSDTLFHIMDSLVKRYPDNNLISRTLYFTDNINYDKWKNIYDRLSDAQKE